MVEDILKYKNKINNLEPLVIGICGLNTFEKNPDEFRKKIAKLGFS